MEIAFINDNETGRYEVCKMRSKQLHFRGTPQEIPQRFNGLGISRQILGNAMRQMSLCSSRKNTCWRLLEQYAIEN